MFVSTKAVEAALVAPCPSPHAKLLLVILAACVDGKLQCFPSLATLCERSGIKSERTVQVHLQALAGIAPEGQPRADPPLLRIETDEAPNGRRTSNVYTVLLAVEGAQPAAPADRPRRRHPNAFKRKAGAVGGSVDKTGGKASDTPQILRGHPANPAGTYPAKSAGLEPLPIKKNACVRTTACPVGGQPSHGTDPDRATRRPGLRYALPAAPVIAGPKKRLPDNEAAAGFSELAERLRNPARSTIG